MSSSKIKVGSLVRFLNATGGGRVARIVKDMAYVEDEDGFEIPTPLNQCVLIGEGDTFVPAYKPPRRPKGERAGEEELSGKPSPRLTVEDFVRPSVTNAGDSDWAEDDEAPATPTRAPHTYVPARGEVELILGVLPDDPARLGQTHFEVYLINDCDYSLYYVYSTSTDGERWELRTHGYLEPSSKISVDEFASEAIDSHSFAQIQAIALAENPGIYKASYALSPRLDASRLQKSKSYTDNPFFAQRAYLLPLVVASKPQTSAIGQGIEALQRSFGGGGGVSPQPTSAIFAPKEEQIGLTVIRQEGERTIVDLHASELLESTAGMDAGAILEYQIDYFRKVMDSYVGAKGKKLIFIHGKGNGTLRNRLLRELGKRYPRCKGQDASFVEYGYGATQVTVY